MFWFIMLVILFLFGGTAVLFSLATVFVVGLVIGTIMSGIATIAHFLDGEIADGFGSLCLTLFLVWLMAKVF